MKNKLKWLVLSVFVLCLTLFSQSDVQAASAILESHPWIFGFHYTYPQSPENFEKFDYVQTDSFTLNFDDGRGSVPVFCAQMTVLTVPGTIYTDEKTDAVNLTSIRASEIATISSVPNTLDNYIKELLPEAKKNMAIAYIWFLYNKDHDTTATPATAWFMWATTLGSAPYYLMDHYTDVTSEQLDLASRTPKIPNGYEYVNTDAIVAASNRPHQFPNDPDHTRMWNVDQMYATISSYENLKNYVRSFNENEQPEFNLNNVEIHPGSSITITDTANVLSKDEYTIKLEGAPSGLSARKEGNNVVITASADYCGEWRGNLVVTRFDIPGNDGANHFYGNAAGEQILFKGGLQKTAKYVPVYVHSGKITVAKKDADTGNVAQGDATLKGAQFTIYTDKACTHAVETIATEKVGNEYIATSDWLKVGTYYVKETQPPTGYNLLDEVLTVTVDGSDHDPLFPKVQLANKVKRGKVHLVKQDDNSEGSTDNPAVGAKLKLHLNSAKTEEENVNTYYAIVKEDGTAEFFDEPWKAKHPDEECTIPYGTYTITEVDGGKGDSTHYFMDNIVEVNINDQGVERYYIVRENPPEPYLSIQKVDKFDGKPVKIAGAKSINNSFSSFTVPSKHLFILP